MRDSHPFIDYPVGEAELVGMLRMACIVIPGQLQHVVQRRGATGGLLASAGASLPPSSGGFAGEGDRPNALPMLPIC